MRRSILDEALVMFAETGDVSLRELAKRLDFSPVAFYRYFSDKEAVKQGLAALAMNKLRAVMVEAGSASDTRERLVQLGLAYVRFSREHPHLFRFYFSESKSARPDVETPFSEESPYAILVGAVNEGMRAGWLRADAGPNTAELVSYSIWALVHGMATLEATHLRDMVFDFDQAHRMAIEALLAGLAAG